MNMVFNIGRLPRIEFGRGSLLKLVPAIRNYGKNVLLVTGSRSFAVTRYWERLVNDLDRAGIRWLHCPVRQEPTAEFIE